MPICLTTRKTTCTLTPFVGGRHNSWDQSALWEEDWLSAAVVNSHLVCDPTIQQPGFDLPRHSWTLLNRFCTGQGPYHANMHKWGLASSPLCDCGELQTMEHIVDTCLIIKLDGGLLSLHEADDDVISWLKMSVMKALTKWHEMSNCSWMFRDCAVVTTETWRAYMRPPLLFQMVPSLTPTTSPSPKWGWVPNAPLRTKFATRAATWRLWHKMSTRFFLHMTLWAKQCRCLLNYFGLSYISFSLLTC